MAEDDKKPAAVYTGWATFKAATDRLAKGIPSRIDKSVFVGQSFGVQSQLIAAFKFLGLMKDDATPTEALSALAAADEAGKKKLMAKILRESYPEVFALDLTKTTPNLFKETIGKYNVTGDTREKAMRFFLQAAMFAGVPMSDLLTKKIPKANGGGATRAARKRRTPPKDDTPPPPALPAAPAAGGTSKSVTLKSGGTLTVSATLDPFALSKDDREFIFELIDKLVGYATTATVERVEAEDEEDAT